MKILLFEDERHNAERLIQLLRKCMPELTVLDIIESVEDGLKWFSNTGNQADLIFMDIQLSDGNCFELFEKISIKTPVVFTTAYDNFALQAFKVYSVDYLMKPIDIKDLERAIEKFKHFSPPANNHFNISGIAEEFSKRENTRFIGKFNNQLIYVKAKELAHVHFADGFTWACTMAGQKIPLDYSLDQIEKMLDRNLFFRINRKLIINIDSIKKITTYYNSRFILQLSPEPGTDAIISRERVGNFKAWLEGKSFSL